VLGFKLAFRLINWQVFYNVLVHRLSKPSTRWRVFAVVQ
jgi:hypothetical protein